MSVCFLDRILLVSSSTSTEPLFLESMLQSRKNVLLFETSGNTRSHDMLKLFTENTDQGYWSIIGWFGFVPLFKDRRYIGLFQIDESLPVSRKFLEDQF